MGPSPGVGSDSKRVLWRSFERELGEDLERARGLALGGPPDYLRLSTPQ